VLLSVYIVAGLICAVAGWMLIGRIASASPQAGTSANLDSITAVVIGGTSLFGGIGTIFGTVVGTVLIGVLLNGLVLNNVSSYVQQIVIGVIIVLAVAFDTFAKSRRWRA
jgi:ribose/xylose/arabinose/galactoside ABC-type transport system permease subunit